MIRGVTEPEVGVVQFGLTPPPEWEVCEPDIAGQLSQAFGVRSIPFCVLFDKGQPVDGFVGAIPEAQIREFLDKHVPSEAELEAEQDAADKIASGAWVEAGALERSLKEYEYQTYWNYRSLQADPSVYDPSFVVHLTAAEVAYYTGLYGADAPAAITTLENSRTQQYRDLLVRDALSREVARIIGLPGNEMRLGGVAALELVHPEDRERTLRVLADLAQHRQQPAEPARLDRGAVLQDYCCCTFCWMRMITNSAGFNGAKPTTAITWPRSMSPWVMVSPSPQRTK